MPRLTSARTAAFDQAFAPLSDDRIDRLAILIGSISHLNLAAGSGHMVDNGTTLAVSPHYCAHCGAPNGHDNGTDGEGDCIHKRALRLAIDAELAMRYQEELDHAAEMDDLRQWAVGL